MIVVIGAGLTGLTVARALHDRGLDVVVVEAADAVPADVRTALGAVELTARPRVERILIAGAWLPARPGAVPLPRRLPASLAVRAGRDVLTAGLRRSRPGAGYAETGAARAGRTMWRQVHEPLAWKRWGVDPRTLSGERAEHDVPPTTFGDVARSLVPFGRSDAAVSVRGGLGAAVESMAATLAYVRLGTKVTAVYEHDDRAIVGLADGRILTATHVVSTVPVTQTARWLGLEDADADIRERAAVLVHLTLDHGPYTGVDLHHFPDRRVLLARLSEPVHSGNDPAGRTVLCAEIPCWADDAVWRTPDDELGLRVRDDLVRSGLPDPRPVSVDVRRVPSVEPVPTPAAIAALGRAAQVVETSRRVTATCAQDTTGSAGSVGVVERALAVAASIRSARPRPTTPRRGASGPGG